MPKTCIKREILEKIRDTFTDDQDVLDALEKIKPCRQTSKYQEFVGQCLKGGGASIKECAAKWRERQG